MIRSHPSNELNVKSCSEFYKGGVLSINSLSEEIKDCSLYKCLYGEKWGYTVEVDRITDDI